MLPAALLRAMADKLVPGIPHSTRIAILQQTETASEEDVKDFAAEEAENKHKTVLQYVLSSDHSRNEVVQKMNCKPPIHLLDFLTFHVGSDNIIYKSCPRPSRQRTRCNRSALFAKSVMTRLKKSCFSPRRMRA